MHRLFSAPGVALALACGVADAAPITLRILAQESIPPKWLTGSGAPTGLCPDILAAIEKVEPRLRFTRAPETRSLPFLEQGLASGHVDAVCALLDTERRRQVAIIAGPALYSVRHRLAARTDDKATVSSMEELVRLKPLINTQRNAAYAGQLRAFGLQVDDSTGNNTVNLKKVIAGHARFFYINELTLTWLMEKEQFKGKVRMLDWVIKEEPIYFHISRKAPAEAVKLVDGALHRLKENGELARIHATWAQSRR